MTRFKEWLVENEDLVAQWKAMRQSAGLGDRAAQTTTSSAKSFVPEPMSQPAKPQSKLPQVIIDALQTGFQTGSIVSDQLVRLLKLDSDRRGLVGSSGLYTASGAYPFVKEKMAGKETGRIRFVKGYPLSKILPELI